MTLGGPGDDGGPMLTEGKAQPSLSVLLPVHNGADTIEQVLSHVHGEIAKPLGAELIICEDGSTDGTDRILVDMAAKYPVRLITDPHRKGYAGAVKDGLSQVRTQAVFFSDSDGQYSPRDFWRLWPYIQEYDIVIGRKVKRREPLHRVLLSRGFHVLAKALFSIPLKDIDCGFRLIRQEVLEGVLPEVRSLPYSFWAEFTILAYRRGFRIIEVPVSHSSRLQGITSIYTFKRLPYIIVRQLLGLVALSRREGRAKRGV